MSFTLRQFRGVSQKKQLRGPVNPLDKSTVFSIYPKPVNVNNITIQPGVFYIPEGSPEKPSFLVVGASSWWKDVPDEPQLIEIVVGSHQVANSIMIDYLNGVFGCDVHDSAPGIFWVLGDHNPVSGQLAFPEIFAHAIDKQNRYWTTLVEWADMIWAAGNSNPGLIMAEMRLAARMLGKMDKDWMKDHQAAAMVRCFACGTFKNPAYPICPSCRVVDPKHPLAADLKFIA